MENKKFSSVFVHQSSYVESSASVGYGTTVWHFTHLDENSVIGDNCTLGQNVYVGKFVKIGNNVKIQNNVSVYSGVVLDDFVFCGPSVVFTNDINPRSKFPKNPQSFLKTRVCEGATIGANATILCGITIGKNALVAAGSVVTKDVKNHSMVMGVPSKHSGWICECGTKLSASFICSQCSRKYLESEDGLFKLL